MIIRISEAWKASYPGAPVGMLVMHHVSNPPQHPEAETKNLLLTAGHNLEAIVKPVILDVSRGDEYYVRLNQQEQTLKPGDMMMPDSLGIISSVLYGPDYRTRITPDTRHAFFVVCAPEGIPAEAVRAHLDDIRANVMIAAPEAEVGQQDIYGVS